MGFSTQEYWSGVPFPPPGDLPHPGMEPASLMSPALAGGFINTGATGKPKHFSDLHPSSFIYAMTKCALTMQYRQSSYMEALELRIFYYDVYDLKPAPESLFNSKYARNNSFIKLSLLGEHCFYEKTDF